MIEQEEEITLDKLLSFKDYKEGLECLYNNLDLSLQLDDYSIKNEDKNNKERVDYIQETKAIKDKYGWDLSELWDFDTTLFKFMLPRLYVFYKMDDTLNQELEDGTFGDILKSIIDGCLSAVTFKEDRDKMNNAMRLLAKYYGRLWN